MLKSHLLMPAKRSPQRPRKSIGQREGLRFRRECTYMEDGFRYEKAPNGRPMGMPFCTRCDTIDGILIRISRTRGKEAPGLCPAHPANRHCQQNFIQRIGRHSGYPVIENPLHLSQKTAWHRFLLGIPIESLRFKKPLFLMWGLFAVRTLNQPPDWSAMITSSQ